jgi:CHAT domain-containing protein
MRRLLAALTSVIAATAPTAAVAPRDRCPESASNAGTPLLRDTIVQDLGPLTAAESRTRAIEGNARHAYRIFLRTGEAARVTVSSQGISLMLSIREPNGTTIAGLDMPSAIVVASETGEYRVITEPQFRALHGGRYRIALRDRRSASRRDRLAYEAQSLLACAMSFRSNAPLQVIQFSEEGSRRAHDAGESALEVRNLFLLGEAKGHLGDFDGAVSTWTRLITGAARIGDSNLTGVTLSSRGRLYLRLGDIAKAQADLNRAAAILAKTGDPYLEAVNGGTLAELAMQTGEIQKALRLYERLLAMTRLTGDKLREGVNLNDLAVAYQRAGDLRRSRVLYDEALVLVRKYGDDRNVAATLHNMGVLRIALDDPRGAIALFEESLRRRGAIDPYGRAVTLGQLGRAYAAAKEQQLARAKLEEALALRAENDVAGRAFVLERLAAVLADAGETDRALDTYAQALGLHRRARQRLGEADALYGLARVLYSQGRLEEAADRIRETLDIVESVRWSAGSRNLRAYFVGAVHDYYATEIDVLMAMHGRSPHASFDARAFEASERGRARSLQEFLADAHAAQRLSRPRGSEAAALLQKQRELGQLLAIRGEQQVRLGSRPHSPQDETALASEVEELSRRYDEIETEIERSGRGPVSDAARSRPPAVTLADVQQLLDGDTMLLEYALGGERSYVWAVTRDSFATYELPARREIESAVRTLRARWSGGGDPVTAGSPEADALGTMLLAPLETSATKRRLLVVPDGALNLIPFGALLLRNRPLLADREIAQLPSAGTLAMLREIRSSRMRAPGTIALFADPVYDVADPRVRANKLQPRLREVGSVVRPASLQETQDSTPPLARLPFSRMEANSILALVPAAGRLQALDFRANRSAITSSDLSGFRILHFATHAVLNQGNPDLSGIVLSLVDSSGSDQPGFVSLLDIVKLNLRAELVVLSACQTAVGDEVAGEGVSSMARAFMQAGATRVVASMWKVDDSATAELMRRFYGAMFGPARLAPAAALRRAQLEVRAMPRWSQPRFWAAFVLLGD